MAYSNYRVRKYGYNADGDVPIWATVVFVLIGISLVFLTDSSAPALPFFTAIVGGFFFIFNNDGMYKVYQNAAAVFWVAVVASVVQFFV